MTDSHDECSAKFVSLAELEPVILEVLAAGGKARLTITGTSNYPSLIGGRDQVTLEQMHRKPQKYDLPLYLRKNGQYVLHRIVSVQPDGSCSCCGDHQWKTESGIHPNQIIGCVVRICRNGKEFSVQSKGYRLWVRIWVFLLPCRKYLIRVFHAADKLKRRFSKQR